jgi:hypothetical protein
MRQSQTNARTNRLDTRSAGIELPPVGPHRTTGAGAEMPTGIDGIDSYQLSSCGHWVADGGAQNTIPTAATVPKLLA